MTEPRTSSGDPPSSDSVARRYDALFLDLDGVVYRGDQAIPGAVTALPHLRRLGVPILFLTNNSARTPDQVAERLRAMGIEARGEDILTSAMATAALLRRDGAAGRTAFVIGERGVREALTGAGVTVLDGDPERADLVVVGWDRTVDYAKLRTAALLVQRGARLIATNADATYPAPDGLWPGGGAILAAVVTATGVTPTVVGKPARPLFEAAAEAAGATHPLVVGDRLDTDIGGAAAMGWDSFLVLTGAASEADLLTASAIPTYVGPDLSALLEDRPPGRFRRAEPEDLDAVRSLLLAGRLGADGVETRMGDTLVSPAAPRSAGNHETLEATATVEEADGVALLRSVAVRLEARRKGLGVLATAAAVAEARARGLTSVYLFTETAGEFFARLGFSPVERGALPPAVADGPHAAACPSAVAMVLALDRPGVHRGSAEPVR